ncbi:hypothetical protein BGW38_006760 [Lunasporangiospora selenospora]|uniref:SLC41A/MgtE integral membrane domain-containing protein n=1 Tax=Lunasporangiospora selenospora TaxID=979761 RepID=A0A9P6FZM2_9FUNG|nr:hypothetical protein BGW38_006760 [Lunasporangiospora selenospora]
MQARTRGGSSSPSSDEDQHPYRTDTDIILDSDESDDDKAGVREDGVVDGSADVKRSPRQDLQHHRPSYGSGTSLSESSITIQGAEEDEDAVDGSRRSKTKAVPEPFSYAEPGAGRGSGDEELAGTPGCGNTQDRMASPENDSHGLWAQAATTLVIAVIGLICAGWLLDAVQHWPVFIEISELIILIPILLNLKGNLEMNLASRLSTASNMGLLDTPSTRSEFVKGNLALLQLQSLTVASVAGLFAFVLGMLVHQTGNNLEEIALMIASSMLCASISSLILGSFMCSLVVICRYFRINPVGLLATIPGWLYYVRRNKFVSEVVKEGWGPVFGAMVISSTAGLTLERYINQFPGMAMISPVLNGLIGNIGSIYASRISTALHANVKENYWATEKTLFLVHIPIEILFLVVVGVLRLGDIQWSVGIVSAYGVVALVLVVITLLLAKGITRLFWKWGYDPDNYALPILTSLIDVLGTAMLVAGFWVLGYGKGVAPTSE